MVIKIGDRIYRTEIDGPLMITLTDNDKTNIANMDVDCDRYSVAEKSNISDADMRAWMDKGYRPTDGKDAS